MCIYVYMDIYIYIYIHSLLPKAISSLAPSTAPGPKAAAVALTVRAVPLAREIRPRLQAGHHTRK